MPSLAYEMEVNDPRRNTPSKTYYCKDASQMMLQLGVVPDEIDIYGRKRKVGRNVVAYFRDHFFQTNNPEYIKGIEESTAFRSGSVVDYENYRKAQVLSQADDLAERISQNPELAREVAEKLGLKTKAAKRE